jgi:hypothetical protein
MYRRMYGTSHHTPSHRLVPNKYESWLHAKSEMPHFLGVFLGAIGVIFVIVVLGIMGLLPEAPHPLFVMLLLISALALLAALISLILLVSALLCRDPHQHCPNCLSYMTRGAKVCPFCGFRPETAPPASP